MLSKGSLSRITSNKVIKKQESNKKIVEGILNINKVKKIAPRNILKSIPQVRQSIPYRLLIKKFTGLPNFSKRSSISNIFIHLTINFYVKKLTSDKLSEQIQLVNNETIHYQCNESLFKKQENKFQFPILLYYHSKIDKNAGCAYFSVNVRLLQMKGVAIQNQQNIGFFIIQNPFIQGSQKNIALIKDNISEFDYVCQYNSDYELMKKTSANCGNVDYQIQSYIQLKPLCRLILQNEIKSSNETIIGLNDNFLPNDPQIRQIVPSSNLIIKIKYLQIHISEKFQLDVLTSLRKLPNNLVGPKDQIKLRKLCIGFWNKQHIVNPINKNLMLYQKQKTGQWRISIFQGINQGEVINLPYYLQEQNYNLCVSLSYQINDKQIQVAQFYFTPLINSQSHDISEQMITNNIKSPIKSQYMIQTNSQLKPTIILQYIAQDILLQGEQSLISLSNHDIKRRANHLMGSSSHKLLQDRTQQLKSKQKLLQQLEYQKLSLEKQKSQIVRLKTQNYHQYQQQFQKKFDLQKQNLLKRQQLIQRQYKQTVQRQILQKMQLEDQIRQMKQRLRKIQDPLYSSTMRPSNQHSGLKQNNQFYRSYQSNYQQQGNMIQRPKIMQRIDPGYLIQPQNQIPVSKVRQMIKKPKISQELIDISKSKFNRASKFTFTFSSIVWFQGITPPKVLYFSIRFFNFPQYRTDSLTYLQTDNQQGYCQLVKLHHFTYNLQNSTPEYVFIVDPSQYKNPQLLQQDLIQYLISHNSIIDIFDGQTHIYLGQLNIKLHQLLRGNKNQNFIAKQYSLIKIKNKQTFGLIQILIKNQQTFCRENVNLKYNSTTKDMKKKIVSLTPMSLPQENQKNIGMSSTQKISGSNKNISRVQQRIAQFKQRQKTKKLQETTNNFRNLPEDDKANILKRISNYKQKKMPDFIKSVYSSLLHEEITISAQFGKASTFPYTFVNQSTYPASYKIVIHSSKKGEALQKYFEPGPINSHQQLSVIKQSSQWRYYVKRKNYMQPKYYQIINDQSTFYLNAGQTLPMVFKYLSFTHYSKNQQDININVLIVKSDNNWIAGGFSLKVEPHQPIVHHSYVLYQPGNQVVDLILPVIYSKTDQNFGVNQVKKLHLTTQDPETQAIWLNQYQILLRISTPKIMHKKSFNLLLYDDQYFNQLKQNWSIVVNAYEGVWAQSRPDFRTKFKIALPFSTISSSLGLNIFSSSLSHSLVLNSSDPQLIFDNDRLLIQFTKLQQMGAYQIWCQIVANHQIKKQIQITCTTEQKNTLVYGWIVQILPYTIRRN